MNISEMTSKELDQLPDWMSGLPTSPPLRAEALAAFEEDGPRGLNRWRQARIEAADKKSLAGLRALGSIQ